MSQTIRVIVNMTYATEAEADARVELIRKGPPIAAGEPGYISYEYFRSITNPRKITLLEHWESKPFYDLHWQAVLARGGGGPPLFDRKTEFYKYQVYVTVNDVWKPIDEDQRCETVMFV